MTSFPPSYLPSNVSFYGIYDCSVGGDGLHVRGLDLDQRNSRGSWWPSVSTPYAAQCVYFLSGESFVSAYSPVVETVYFTPAPNPASYPEGPACVYHALSRPSLVLHQSVCVCTVWLL